MFETAADSKILTQLILGVVMDGISSGKYTQGAELLSASMSKSQQQQEGKMALALIEAAASSSPAQSNLPSPTATMGNHINIKV